MVTKNSNNSNSIVVFHGKETDIFNNFWDLSKGELVIRSRHLEKWANLQDYANIGMVCKTVLAKAIEFLTGQ